MNAKRLALGTIVGAVAVIVSGYLVFYVFGDFYRYAMNAGSTNVARERPLLWALVLGTLLYAAFITLEIGARSTSLNVMRGMKIGALVSFLLWLTADLMLFAVSNVGSAVSTFVDPLLETIPGAIAGGAIAVAIRRT